MMQLKELIKYCEEHNVPDQANICFKNLDNGGYVYADRIQYNEEFGTIDLSI